MILPIFVFVKNPSDTEGLSEIFYVSRYVETDIVSPHAINAKLLFKSHVLRKAGFFIWNVVLIIVSETHTHTRTHARTHTHTHTQTHRHTDTHTYTCIHIFFKEIFGTCFPFNKFMECHQCHETMKLNCLKGSKTLLFLFL